MSKYTTEVRFICENLAGLTESKGCNDVDDILDDSWDKIFGNFPIFDEEYREGLCKKILKHFYTREIGYETVGLWKLKLNTKMEEIMPYYNQLYESALIEYEALGDVDYTRNKEGTDSTQKTKQNAITRSGTNSQGVMDSSVTDGTNGKTDKFSDTPQGSLNGVANDTYLTEYRAIGGNSHETMSATKNVTGNTSETKNESENQNEEKDLSSTEHVFGKMNGRTLLSQALLKYRETFLNIDMMVIRDLESLFMLLW